jgi:hypothetical protein
VIAGEDAFLYINTGEEANVYDCERRSTCTSVREEVNAYECERRSMCTSTREEVRI